MNIVYWVRNSFDKYCILSKERVGYVLYTEQGTGWTYIVYWARNGLDKYCILSKERVGWILYTEQGTGWINIVYWARSGLDEYYIWARSGFDEYCIWARNRLGIYCILSCVRRGQEKGFTVYMYRLVCNIRYRTPKGLDFKPFIELIVYKHRGCLKFQYCALFCYKSKNGNNFEDS